MDLVNKRFRVCDLNQSFLLPPSLQDWLPQDHLARFVADVANELDLSAIYAEYERTDGRGLSAYHPLMMTRLLLYGYCIGVTSSRKIEKATYDSLAFRYLAADQHPDHDSIAGFRQEHLEALRLLTAGGGWPTWQGTFLPYGEEYNPQVTSNHYKFTGKERDNESGLDYFGAR